MAGTRGLRVLSRSSGIDRVLKVELGYWKGPSPDFGLFYYPTHPYVIMIEPSKGSGLKGIPLLLQLVLLSVLPIQKINLKNVEETSTNVSTAWMKQPKEKKLHAFTTFCNLCTLLCVSAQLHVCYFLSFLPTLNGLVELPIFVPPLICFSLLTNIALMLRDGRFDAPLICSHDDF